MTRTAAHGLLTTDSDLAIRTWNGWLASASGWSEAEVAGRPLLELVPAESRDHFRELFAEVLDQGATRVLSPGLHPPLMPLAALPPAAGPTRIQQLVTLAPLRDGETTVGLILTIEDVSGRDGRGRTSVDGGVAPAPQGDALEAVAGDWRSRPAAVRRLIQSGDADAIADLLRSLERRHLDFNALSGALQVLVGSQRASLGPLAALLGDPDANLRMHAAQALGLLAEREAVAPLVAALDDPDPNVRFHALEALGRLRAPEAVEALLRVATSGDFFLAFPAIDALALIDDPAVSHELIPLLADGTLGAAVVEALRVVGDEECVAPLMHGLGHGDLDPSAVAAAIVAIHDRYEDSDHAGQYIRDRLAEGLTDVAVERLIAAVERHAEPLAPTIRVLGWLRRGDLQSLAELLGDERAQEDVADALASRGADAVEPIVGRLRAGSRDARLAAAALLERLADARATPALIEAADQGDSELTAIAASALAAIGDARALPALVGLFRDHDARVRRAAAAAVNAIGGHETQRLVVACAGDPDPHVRECAVRSAGYLGFAGSGTIVRHGLRDANELVRRAAIEHLPFLDDDDLSALLIGCARSESAPNRAAAAHALRLVATGTTTAALIGILEDPDPWVRYFAAGSLGSHAAGEAADALARLAIGDSAPQVRISALRALSEAAPAAGSAIATTLVAAEDDDLAVAAVRALGDASGAVDLLAEAAGSTRPALRLAAVEALGGHLTDVAVARLAEAARQPVDPPLAAPAILALGRIAAADGGAVGRGALAALFALAVHVEWREAVLRTAPVWSPALLAWLETWLTSQPAGVRRVAIDGLSRMHHPGASDLIVGSLHDEDATVRSAAIGAVGRLGSLGAAAVAGALASTDPDPGVRRRALVACRRHGWPLHPGAA